MQHTFLAADMWYIARSRGHSKAVWLRGFSLHNMILSMEHNVILCDAYSLKCTNLQLNVRCLVEVTALEDGRYSSLFCYSLLSFCCCCMQATL